MRRPRPRQMWTDYPTPQDWAPEPGHIGSGDVRNHGHAEAREPIARILLPDGTERPVYGPERERIGFRR